MRGSGNKRWICVLSGVLAGILLLVPVTFLLKLRREQQHKHLLRSQEFLLPANGVNSADSDRVSVAVRVTGAEAEACGISFDPYVWYTSSSEEIELALPPGEHTLRATRGNREVWQAVRAPLSGSVELDMSLAPDVPEYTVLELPDGGVREISLPPEYGIDPAIAVLPDGVSLERRQTGSLLRVDTDIAAPYLPLRVEAVNAHGRAVGFIGLRILRETESIAIESPQDLLQIRENPAGDYYLTGDLDLSDWGPWRSPTTQEQPFTGSLDGRGHAIIGLRLDLTPDQTIVSFLGTLKGAQVENLLFVDPLVQGAAPDEPFTNASVLAYTAESSLVANCAVLGGMVDAQSGLASGLLANATNSHLLRLFNSADISAGKSAFLPTAAGICGGPEDSYLAGCANEGTIQGHHLVGGIAAYSKGFVITRCINSGQVRGIPLASTLLPGGINQSAQDGFRYNCYYAVDQSPVGTGGVGPASRVLPVTGEQLRIPSELVLLGAFGGDTTGWGYASLHASGPVPAGIFPAAAPEPIPTFENDGVTLQAREGCVYFYTLDGGDPRLSGIQAESLSLPLRVGERLTVYRAAERAYDSQTVTVTAEGVVE